MPRMICLAKTRAARKDSTMPNIPYSPRDVNAISECLSVAIPLDKWLCIAKEVDAGGDFLVDVLAAGVDRLVQELPWVLVEFRTMIERCRTTAAEYDAAAERPVDDDGFEVPPDAGEVDDLPAKPFVPLFFDADKRRPEGFGRENVRLPGYYWKLAVIHDRCVDDAPKIIRPLKENESWPYHMFCDLHSDFRHQVLESFDDWKCWHIAAAQDGVRADLLGEAERQAATVKPQHKAKPRPTKYMTREAKLGLVAGVLKKNPNATDKEIAEAAGCGARAVRNWKKDVFIGKAWHSIGIDRPKAQINRDGDDLRFDALDVDSPAINRMRKPRKLIRD